MESRGQCSILEAFLFVGSVTAAFIHFHYSRMNLHGLFFDLRLTGSSA